MAIPALAIGGLLGAAEGNRQNILKDDPNDPGGQFLNYYIKDRLPTILGGGLGAAGGGALGHLTGWGAGKGGLVGGALGAVLGGVIGHSNSNAQSGMKKVCNTEVRYDNERQTVYSHSTIKFLSQGKWYTLDFKRK